MILGRVSIRRAQRTYGTEQESDLYKGGKWKRELTGYECSDRMALLPSPGVPANEKTTVFGEGEKPFDYRTERVADSPSRP